MFRPVWNPPCQGQGMEKKEKVKLEKFLATYFKEIHKIYTVRDSREESFYPTFKSLFEDCSKLFQKFKTTRWEDDPVIHFYEIFLGTYNPKERERLGVYYTPLPVVSYIVESIHELLKDGFKKTEGLATSDVTLLDPTAGTVTFVVQAIKQVQKELEDKKKEGLIKSYIEEHVIPHFHAFEILVAPYTVGHFKVSMVLEDMDYRFKEGKRFQFYLTNTLEMKDRLEDLFRKKVELITNGSLSPYIEPYVEKEVKWYEA
jgi:predicted helicase